MHDLKAAAAGAAALLLMSAPAKAADPAPIVFFDIATPDIARDAAFYRKIFAWEVAADGRVTVPVTRPLPGTLRTEPPNMGPATERLIYVGVPDITRTLKEVTDNGGAVVYPRFAVPGVVVLGLFTDPAGNRMGLVETKDGVPFAP